jgi:hypothetical protein
MFLEEKRSGERLAPSPQNLAYLLRHEELWPKGFEWNYHDHTRCAMGLACLMWPEICYACSWAVADALGMDPAEARLIFVSGNKGAFGCRIKPKQIARALERL